MRRGGILLVVLFVGAAIAQTVAPSSAFPIDGITDGLSDPDLITVPGLISEIERRGINFDLNAENLGKILASANMGKRDPKEVAALVLTALKTCPNCRAKTLEPITVAEIKTLQTWGFADSVISEEARIRGVKDLQITKETAAQLLFLGIKPEVVDFLVPDDRIPIGPQEGYTPVMLKRSEAYDIGAPEGSLRVTTSLRPSTQSEFLFKHNGLFVKAVKGVEPEELGAYFNKPTPRNTDIDKIEITSGLEESEDKGFLGLGKKPSPIEVTKVPADGDGRTAFRITVTNRETKSYQHYSFYVRWRILNESKPASAATKQ